MVIDMIDYTPHEICARGMRIIEWTGNYADELMARYFPMVLA